MRNTATLSSSTTDSNAANNTASADVVISQKTDLAIVKTADDDEVAPGDTITYTLVATNKGTRSAANVVVSDPLPAEVTFVSASTGCTQANKVVTCPLGTLTAGASKTVTIKVKANAVTRSVGQRHAHAEVGHGRNAGRCPAGQTKSMTVSCATGYVVTDASVRMDDLGDVTGSKLVDVRSVQQTSDQVYTATVRNGTTTKSTVRPRGLLPQRHDVEHAQPHARHRDHPADQRDRHDPGQQPPRHHGRLRTRPDRGRSVVRA